MFVWTQTQLLAAIDAVTAALDPTTLHVRLYSTPVTPTINSVLTDFTEADFTGYAAVAITGVNPATWLGQGAAAEYLIPPAVFTPTGTTVTNIIYGYYITQTGTPNVLIGAEAFQSPIPMASPANQIILGTVLGIADAGLPATIY